MRLKGGRLFLTTAMMLPMLSSALAADVVISGTKLVVPPKPQLPAAPEIDAPAPKVTAPSPVVAVAAPKPLIPEAKAKPKPVDVKDKAAAAPSVKVKKAAKPDTVAKPAPVVAAKKNQRGQKTCRVSLSGCGAKNRNDRPCKSARRSGLRSSGCGCF